MKSLIWILAALAAAQEPAPDRLKASFRDPSRPGTLSISLIHGGMTVKGYDGREVVVEAARRAGAPAAEEKSGMRRILDPSTGLAIEEENNVMRISASSHLRAVDLTVQVPLRTSLKLRTINNGAIRVENVEGDIEVSNVNGAVTLDNVAGSAVAHALNGAVTATFRAVAPGKPMSFTSLNGRIDVTLPASVKASLKMKSDRGEIYSDFDVVVPPRAPAMEESKDGKGRYRVRTESGVAGSINGGGPEITFKTMNGDVYIRRGK